MKKKFFVFLTLFIYINSFVISQESIKIMTYNLLNFGNYTDYCTQQNNNHITKAQYLKTIINSEEPDILAVCELSSNINYMNYILGNSLNTDGTTKWEKIDFTNLSRSYLVNGIFYDKTKFSYDPAQAIDAIRTDVRDINIYKLKYINSTDINLHIITVHLKAGNTESDRQQRTEMVNSLMDRLAVYNDKGNNFIIVGDFNVYSDTETAFQNIINPVDPEIAFYDPVERIGNWHNNSRFNDYHTQSTHTENNGCSATGGLDDRFDFILVSSSIIDGSKKVRYIDDSYNTVGQDGERLKKSLIEPANNSLPDDIIDALYNMSDHLPVTAEFYIGEVSSISTQSSDPSFYARIINPVNSTLEYEIRTKYNNIPVTMNIFNVIGNKVYSEKIEAKSGNYYTSNISKLPNGIYIVTFEGEKIFKSYKIVKTD